MKTKTPTPEAIAPRRLDGEGTLCVIVPVHNEAENIDAFMARIERLRHEELPTLALLFVDDGSTDDTLTLLRNLHAQHGWVNYLSLSRNFGKEAALTAGIDRADGDAAILMDADLQHPPELLPHFVKQWRAGFDMVYAVRTPDDAGGEYRPTSRHFYRVFNRLADTRIPPDAGDFRLLDRRVIEALRALPEKTRFMKGLYAWVGFRSTGVPYQQPPRTHGSSAFDFWKRWNFALDGVFSFSTWPLRIWTYVGAVIAFLAFVYAALIVFSALSGSRDTPGYASLMTAILFFGGVQLLSVGILGEYIGRLFSETKNRPIYLVAESSEPAKQDK